MEKQKGKVIMEVEVLKRLGLMTVRQDEVREMIRQLPPEAVSAISILNHELDRLRREADKLIKNRA